MRSNRLQLNTDETELRLYLVCAFRGGSTDFSLLQSGLELRSHFQRTVADWFADFRQIRSVRRSVPPTTLETLVVSLVLTRLDYGNATLADIPSNLLRRLQAVLIASARIIHLSCRLGVHQHIALLAALAIRAAERIKCKLATLT